MFSTLGSGLSRSDEKKGAMMDRRNFLVSVCAALAGSAGLLFLGGCIAPLISPAVKDQESQAWRCDNCGHLTRSDRDLTNTRCPRCKRKGFLKRITEQELQDCVKRYNT
jgi:DNA-directed RNA polymerase subunit RPC12/RpoP